MPEVHFASAGGDRYLHLSPTLQFPPKALNDVWTIYGKRGSGKSYFLGKMVEELARLEIPFIILDIKSAHRLITLPHVSHLHMNDGPPQALVPRLGNGESLIVSFRGADTDEMREYVKEFCTAINRCGFGPRYHKPVVVAIEECHNFVGQGAGSAGGKGEIRSQCMSAVDRLIREGRQDGVGAVLISQSVANVLASVRRQAEVKVIFNIRDHTDIKQLRETLIGKSKGDVDKIIDRVYAFGIGEFICVSPTYIGGAGIITDKTAERTTEHAGRSFIEEDPGNRDDFTLEPMPSYNAHLGDYDKNDDSPDDKEIIRDMKMDFGTAPPKSGNRIDYKSAIGLTLLGLSVLGFVFVFIKKRYEQRELDKEKEIEQRLSAQMKKVEHIQNRQANEEKPIIPPAGQHTEYVPTTKRDDPLASPVFPGSDDLDDYSPFGDFNGAE